MPRKEMPSQGGGESANLAVSPTATMPLATSIGRKGRKRVAAAKPPRPARTDLSPKPIVQDAILPPSREASPAKGDVSPTRRLPGSILPPSGEVRQALKRLSPKAFVPDADQCDVIAGIVQLHREHRALQTAAGDMLRRIKSAQRWVAVARYADRGIPLAGKFPDVTPEDDIEVRRRFPSFYSLHSEIEACRKDAKRKLDHLAGQLPAAGWFASFRGLGIGSLGAIVGCTGDLSNYANPAKLWKRLGLDVTPQGKAPKRVVGVKSEYNPRRRAEIRMIGSAIIRAGGEDGWVEVYRQRKAYEISKAQASGRIVLPAARISTRKDKSLCISEGHIHNRALRYMEKRLIRDLWRQWTGRGVEWSEQDKLAAD